MKSNAVPSFYFSAYPLKALPAGAAEAIKSEDSKIVVKSKLRVLPMVNPYTRMPNDGETDPSWFNHYE